MSMLRRVIVGAAVCLLATAPAGAASEAAESASEKPPVQVLGEVPMRPEVQDLSGVRGWRVNGDEITVEDVRDAAVRDHGPYILHDMVCVLLLEQEAKRRGITVTDEEIDAKLKALLEAEGVSTQPALDRYLRARRVTPAWLREKARGYLLMEKVLSDQVYISDRDVERFFNQYRDFYRRGDTVSFRIISVPTEKAAQDALAALRAGRSFETVAKECAPPENQAVAGQLHEYERGRGPGLAPELEAAIFSAPLNQVVGPIKANDFYHLVRVEKKIDAHQFTLDEVREQIRSQLRTQKLEQEVWPRWIAQHLKDAKIEVLRGG